jgi:gliding-associated putative ABC transporter substrate-binding component GldG
MNIKLKSNFIISAGVLFVILIIVNVIGYKKFYRIDLTQNKEFSITDATKSTLKNLDGDVDIKFYLSEKLPLQYMNVSQEVKDILDEYRNYSRGKMRIFFIDPKDDTTLKTEAQELGIPQMQFNVMEKDEFQITQGYLGLAIIYGEKNEVLPFIEDSKNLEYKLTSAIKKVVATSIGKVGFTVGHGEPEVQPQYGESGMLWELLSQQFNVVQVDITSGDVIAEDIDTLIINGPTEAFTDRELYVVDQFLMKGKNILFLIDGVVVDQNLVSTSNDTNLEKLLAGYGINFEKNLVLDVSNEVLHFNDGRSIFGFMSNYPFWVKAKRENFDQGNVIVNHLETLLFPWVSSMSINKDITPDNSFSEIVQSTEKSWEQKETFNLDPTSQFSPSEDSLHKRVLAASISGKFSSYFTGKEIPLKESSSAEATEDKEVETEEEADESAIEIVSEGAIVNSTESGRIIVVGDSDFIDTGTVQRAQNNLIFFQNAIDVLTQDESLVSIRAKGSNDRPIKELDEKERNWIKFINILGVSILVLIIGVGRSIVRKRGNK